MLPSLSRRAPDLRERIEDPACDLQVLFNTYRQFAPLNSLISRWRPIYRRYLRPCLKQRGGGTLLDIGFGGGDIPIRLADWARGDGLCLDVTAIDTDPRSLEYARQQHAGSSVRFLQVSAEQLGARGERFDLVVSNHLLHHLSEVQLPKFLAAAAALAGELVVLNDIARSTLAYLAFAATTKPFFRRSHIVADGLTSIRRSYTASELRALAPPGWQVDRAFPWRLLLVHRHAVGLP